MIAPLSWMAALFALVLLCVAAYLVAPGLGVLLFVLGTVALVVVGDRVEKREDERLRAERLREAVRRSS